MEVALLGAIRAVLGDAPACPCCSAVLRLVQLAEQAPNKVKPGRKRAPRTTPAAGARVTPAALKVLSSLKGGPVVRDKLIVKYYGKPTKLCGPLFKSLRVLVDSGLVAESDGFYRLTEQGDSLLVGRA